MLTSHWLSWKFVRDLWCHSNFSMCLLSTPYRRDICLYQLIKITFPAVSSFTLISAHCCPKLKSTIKTSWGTGSTEASAHQACSNCCLLGDREDKNVPVSCTVHTDHHSISQWQRSFIVKPKNIVLKNWASFKMNSCDLLPVLSSLFKIQSLQMQRSDEDQSNDRRRKLMS